MMKRSFGLKAAAMAAAIVGFAVAQAAAQCTHNPQLVISNAGPGPWSGTHTFTGTEDNTINSTPEIGDGLCFFDGAANTIEVVYEFTAPATGLYTIDTLTSTVNGADTKLWIFTNCADPVGTDVGCNDDISGSNFLSSTTVNLTAATTYFISVEGWGSAAAGGTGNVNISFAPPPPANDTCAGATPLTLPFAEDVNLAVCNDEGLDNSESVFWGGGLGHDVFYTFTPTTTGNYRFFAQGVDSGVAHYTGSCGSLVEVGALDDVVGGEAATWNLTSGTPYTLMAEGFDDTVLGTMKVVFGAVSTTPSTGNDACLTPLQINVSPFSDPGVDMSGNANWVNFGGIGGVPDQTYRFTAPAAGGYTFTVSPTSLGFDAQLFLLADNCSALAFFSPGSGSDSNGAFNGTAGSGDEAFEATMTAGQSLIAVVTDGNFLGGTMDFSVAGTSTVSEWSIH